MSQPTWQAGDWAVGPDGRLSRILAVVNAAGQAQLPGAMGAGPWALLSGQRALPRYLTQLRRPTPEELAGLQLDQGAKL